MNAVPLALSDLALNNPCIHISAIENENVCMNVHPANNVDINVLIIANAIAKSRLLTVVPANTIELVR